MSSLIERDLQHVWHPCSQMKDYEDFPPLPIAKAQGCHLTLQNGQKIIDSNASWWCKSLGHNEPRIKAALLAQCEQFEHVILANTCNETLAELSERLAGLTQNLNKVMYASDGSCAVEIALKMALHAKQLLGQPQRTKFIALENGYHGETCLTLSMSDIGLYREPYQPLLQPCQFLTRLPYVNSKQDPLWHDCSEIWPGIQKQLEQQSEQVCAIILEPILQCAGGMLIYSQDFLKRLRKWSLDNDVFLISDEIATGFGRTGKALACEHAEIEADFVCLSKGLTAGWLPLSACLTSDTIYQLFYDDYETGKAFMHSHTHTGNALAAACANATLQIIEQENIYQRTQNLEKELLIRMQQVSNQTGRLKNIRNIGGMVAADLIADDDNPKHRRLGFEIYKEAVGKGALLRPLGNTLYWYPPLIIDNATLDQLTEITSNSILACI